MASQTVELLLLAKDKASSALNKAKGSLLAFAASSAGAMLAARNLIQAADE